MSDERTCIVTGGSRGIGQGIAKHLGERGWNVVVNYHYSAEPAERTVEAIAELGGDAIAVQADVTNMDAVEDMRDETHETFGRPHALVNNAGITSDERFGDMAREEWDRVIEVNLGGAFNTTKAFFPDLKSAEHGRLINISSVIGKQGNYGQANYAAAKSGLFGFTRSIALELAPHDSTANCIAPGYTETDMVRDVREDILEELRERIPLRRFASVEEIAAVVGFIASEDSSYMTGEVIDVNGAYDL